MSRLEGKVAFVTGAGSGIGEAIAKAFAAEGAHVVVADINEDAATVVAMEIGTKAIRRHLDVTDGEAFERALKDVTGVSHRLDILVNNAGVSGLANVEDCTEELWQRNMDVNAKSVFLGCKYAIPIMKAAGGGCIINIASAAALLGTANRFPYTAAKAAVVGMTLQMTADYAKDGIRCNAICPGTIDTPFVRGYIADNHSDDPEGAMAKLIARHPVGHLGTPEDVADLAVYIATAGFMAGSIVAIDGGWTAL